jgi:type II secretory pathway pseudopilin PulG
MISILNSSDRSFTLIETVVSIAIFALSMGAAVALVVMTYRNYTYSWQQSLAIDEARKGVETMVKEIREARPGDDGSYPIEKAEDKEFIFYSDIDKDGDTERIRYFLGSVNSSSQTEECVTFTKGGFCSVTFSDFFTGDLESAEVRISVEGDFGWNVEYAEIFADSTQLGNICESGCSDCAGAWQGTLIFDVTDYAQDNSIQFTADSTYQVDSFCDWIEHNHAMKVKFELSWTESLAGSEHEFKKAITNPNPSPMQLFLVINVNPNRPPQDFELKSSVQLRNLKNE